MSIELKQAAQQALSAMEKSQPHPSNPVIGLTNQDFIDHEETIRKLRTAIQQAESDHARLPGVLKDHQIAAMVNSLRDIARQFHGHDSLRERIANVLVPALKAEAKTDEPDGYVRVPLQVLHDASDALGNFIMDHGWGDSDMQAMDNLDAYIAQHTAAHAQKGD